MKDRVDNRIIIKINNFININIILINIIKLGENITKLHCYIKVIKR
jgi:hypothetical protein